MEEELERSQRCLQLLRTPLQPLLAAQTFTSQLSLLDVYASLGHRASAMVGPTLQAHLPKGVAYLKHPVKAADKPLFIEHCAETLQHLNDAHKAPIVSFVAPEVVRTSSSASKPGASKPGASKPGAS